MYFLIKTFLGTFFHSVSSLVVNKLVLSQIIFITIAKCFYFNIEAR